jgi:hypothetical protein
MTPISIELFNTKEPVECCKEFVCDENSFEPITYLDMDPFDVYQRDMSSGWMALGGICISTLFSIVIICCGISLAYYRHTIDEVALPSSWRNGPFGAATAVFVGVIAILPTATPSNTEVLSLALTLVVTICTESIGFVHSMTLKSALIHESRLHCNTNLRLFTAARGTHWTNPNGTLLNAVMAILLIVSYVSSSLVFIPFHARAVHHSLEAWWNTCIFAPPVLTLGTALLLQGIIAMAGLSRARVLTWSSSPINTTAALLHDGQLARISGRCMHHVLHSTSYPGPRPPLERQPSAWQAHPSIKKIVITLWCLVLACLIWGGMVIIAWAKWFRTPLGPGIGSWSIFPNVRTNLIGYEFYVDPDRGCPVAVWIGIFIVFIILQGGVTMGLHCSEVIANVARDELIWRRATSNGGIKPSKNPLMTALESWPNVGLLIAKPVLRKHKPSGYR